MTDTTTNEPTGGENVPEPAELAAAVTAGVQKATRPAGNALVAAVRNAIRDELRNGRSDGNPPGGVMSS